VVAEREQLALESQVAPAWVLPRHPHHQGGEDVVDRWASGPVGVGPSSADEAAMPAQDRVRGDQAMAMQRSGQPPDEGGEHRSVRPVQARSWVGAAQYGDFVAARGARRPWWRTFCPLVGPVRAPLEDQVQQPKRHSEIMPSQRSSLVSDPGPDFWHPTGQFAASFDAVLADAGIEVVKILPRCHARTASPNASC
jgi:hypothetical protein